MSTITLNDVADANIDVIPEPVNESVTQFERSWLNDVAPLNMDVIVVTLLTSHVLIGLLNEVAFMNIECMLVTLEVLKFEMSLLKADAV